MCVLWVLRGPVTSYCCGAVWRIRNRMIKRPATVVSQEVEIPVEPTAPTQKGAVTLYPDATVHFVNTSGLKMILTIPLSQAHREGMTG